jgi:transcriptional regulator with XRE-family HTH domain
MHLRQVCKYADGLSQLQIAELAGVDVALVDKFEKGELLPRPGVQVPPDQIAAYEQIVGAIFKVLVQRYPEKVKAAVDPVLELAKTYPEGSVMRNFLNSAEGFLKP